MSLFGGKEWGDFSFEERLAVKVKAESSFLNFTRIFFELIQGEEFKVNWHHRWMANEIDRRVKGETNQSLALALPPGSTKSEFLSIHIHAYTLALIGAGKLKRFRNLSLSSGDSLVQRNSKRIKDIINSREFSELWPSAFATNQAEEWIVKNDKDQAIATMVSKSMGGQIIGSRGGYMGAQYSGGIFIDDPQKAENVFSAVKRERDQRLLTNTVRSRRGDKSHEHPTPIFLVQQRLHKEDAVGFCVGGGMGIDFQLIKVPALMTPADIAQLPDGVREDCVKRLKDSPQIEKGGVTYTSFWEENESIYQLMDLWERDEFTFCSQYLQEPVALSGNLVDTSWFPRFDTLPADIVGGAVYVDTNSGKVKERNDYTVFTLAMEDSKGNLYIPAVKRGKWDPEELLSQAESLWSEWNEVIPTSMRFKLRYMSVEDKQAGQGLIQTLTKKKRIPLHAQPRGAEQNKYARHCNTQPTMKLGKVYLPMTYTEDGHKVNRTTWINGDNAYTTDWVVPFLSELDSVTVGVLMDQETGYDDQYDTLMDAVDDMLLTGQSSLAAVLAARKERRNRR